MTDDIEAEERLPLELKALIVAELASQGDRASIGAFSLTQRAMMNLCQEHIFQDIRLTSFALVCRLRLLLYESAHLAQHVRALHFREHMYDDDFWLYTDSNVSDILAVVPNLLHLTLYSAGSPHNFSPALCEALCEVLPSLHTLGMASVHGAPATLFSSMKSLRGLHMSYTTFAPYEGWARIRTSTMPASLIHLHIEGTLPSAPWFDRLLDRESRFPLSVRALRTLHVECPSDGRSDHVESLLSNVADTLHALEMNMEQLYEWSDDESDDEPPFITLERMHALKVLILRDIPYNAHDDWARMAISVPSLEHLVVNFDEDSLRLDVPRMIFRLFGPDSPLKVVTVHLDHNSYLGDDLQLKDALCKHYHSPTHDGRKVTVEEVSRPIMEAVPPADGSCRIMLYEWGEWPQAA
ncbi:hypothetical protein BD626DRAFT_563626 [Schizophyllum amplum]|uniref:F-box domain-containing protein n=1 Tax=Schizophyllum amplum TaxID=97359 RepID=A0A550CYQ1_9AGAR|nr:hypothetical protein BD626DRAFT_563626 [Auriculariopsis ampla]